MDWSWGGGLDASNRSSRQSRSRNNSRIAWVLCGVICIGATINYVGDSTVWPSVGNFLDVFRYVAFGMIPIVFAVLGALIISRQPHNVIGWLLLIPAFAFTVPAETYVNRFTSAPPVPSILLLLALWMSNWGWLLLIFPILFIPLLFPTGRPPSSRWRWLVVVGLSMCVTFLFVATFQQKFRPTSDADWSVTNPIGFIPDSWAEEVFLPPWLIALITLAVLCVVSLFVRYRRASAVEREQIKWLLYACGLFVAVYVPGFWATDSDTILQDVWDILFSLGILAIPIAIAIAILRYRLWEIDVIIRRTLVYGALTATLALVYIGGVVLLQGILQALGGRNESPVAVVISTLVIAALFTPLRRRIQNDIDRRFYRQKYDARRTAEEFANRARDEVELDVLTGHLLESVEKTLQPESVSLWLRKGKR